MRSSLATMACLAFGLIVVSCPSTALSQQDAKGLRSGEATANTIVYKPPMRGAPAGGGRIAAAVRGEEGESPVLIVLAPDHPGATSQRQPVLYWYISKPTNTRIEFTLNDENRGKTVVQAVLPAPQQPGIQAVRLADFKAELSPDIVYQWFVTIESDPNQPAKDVYNGGSIMYLEPSPDLSKKVSAAASSTATAGVYAAEGFWYDALASMFKSGKKDEEKTLRQQRVSLLKQVGYGAPGPGKPKTALDGEVELLRYLGQ